MKPTAYLFAHGTAAFFDPTENQIPELQRHGWGGLAEFVRRYPKADVFVQGGTLTGEDLTRVPKHLRDEVEP